MRCQKTCTPDAYMCRRNRKGAQPQNALLSAESREIAFGGCRLACRRNCKHRWINCRSVKSRLVVIVPDRVSNARGISLVCWSGSSLTLLNWLSIQISEVPEFPHGLVHSCQFVVLRLTLVIDTIEVALVNVRESVPESTLRR